jgi:predicted methyltransferase
MQCLDTGSEVTLISRAVVPDAAIPKQTSSLKTARTLAGTLTSNQVVSLRDIRLPEFDSNRKIKSKKCLIFDQPCQYDMILGSNFLAQVKIDISYKNKCVSWFGNTIPLQNKRDFTRQDFDDLVKCFESQIGEDDLGDDWMESYVTRILDAKYEKLDLDALIATQTHFDEVQRQSQEHSPEARETL